jgi:hypothetical protein
MGTTMEMEENPATPETAHGSAREETRGREKPTLDRLRAQERRTRAQLHEDQRPRTVRTLLRLVLTTAIRTDKDIIDRWRQTIDPDAPDPSLVNDGQRDSSQETETENPEELAPEDVDRASQQVAFQDLLKTYEPAPEDDDDFTVEQPTVEDMLSLFRAKGVVVSLVDTRVTNRLVQEIAAAVVVK